MTASARETAARAALDEITPAGTVGALVSESAGDNETVTLLFEATMAGYPGWSWTVSLAELPDEAPAVLETELMPGDGALLAPDWVPWSDRLDDYRAAQLAAVEAAEEVIDDLDADDLDDDGDSDDDGDDLDDDDLDDVDPDDLTALRRGGGRDGIEIDFLADLDVTESGLLAVGEDEQDEAEPESDQDSPEPPRSVGRKKRAQRNQQPAESD